VDYEPARKGEDAADCSACNAPDEAYIWVSERWRVRAMDRPTGLPMVLILESRSHLDLGDLPNLLAAELGVMTVRLERAVRSLDGVARVHVNRWGDGSAHLHMWFLARPYGRLQLRGTFLSLWDDILPPIPESRWRENLALVAAWLAEFGGRPLAEPPRIEWQAPSSLVQQAEAEAASLALQAEADDASVALLEAPADEEKPDEARLDEARRDEARLDEARTDEEKPAGKATEVAAPGEAEAAQEATALEGESQDTTTGSATPDRATAETATSGEAGAAPAQQTPAPAANPGPAAEATASADAATVDLARHGSEGQPARAVPVARSGDQPEPQRAAT
jgi:hypothetical protein